MNELWAINILHDLDLKATKTRVKILNCLNHGHHFHTISDIKSHLKNVNLKSIYNNINLMQEKGIIDSYVFLSVPKFALSDRLIQNKTNLVHIISENENIDTHFEIDKKFFNEIAQKIEEKDGHKVDQIKIFVHLKK